MANVPVDALRDELVSFADLETDRPVLSQVRVGPPKEPEGGDHGHGSKPRNKRRKAIIRKCEQGREQVEKRQKNDWWKHRGQQNLLRPVESADGLFFVLGALEEHMPNPEIHGKAGEKDDVPRLQNIHGLPHAVPVLIETAAFNRRSSPDLIASLTVLYWTEFTSGRESQVILVLASLKEIGRRSHAREARKSRLKWA